MSIEDDDPKAPHEFCPIHGNPDDPLLDWPCPLAYEDSPPEVENCPYFVAELERRIAEVSSGNYYELTEYDEHGVRWFVGHGTLAGQRKRAWSREEVSEGDNRDEEPDLETPAPGTP